MITRNINDDNTLAYLFNKVFEKVKGWVTPLLDGKVSKTGDTMTGDLVISNRSLYIKNTTYASQDTPSSSSMKYVYFRDKNDHNIAYFGSNISSSGKSGMILAAGRQVESSSTPGTYSQVENIVGLYVDSNGNRTVDITNAGSKAAWRSALGLGTSGALPITIAQGGTGATDATSAIYGLGGKVFKRATANSSTNVTISFSGVAACAVFACGGSSGQNCGFYIIYCNGASATPVIRSVAAASALTLTASAGKVVASATGTTYLDVMGLQSSTWANRITVS